MRHAMLLAFALVLTACADKHWTRPGATYDSFMADSRNCAQDATMVYSASAGGSRYGFRYDGGGPRVDKDMYRACMQARGYRRVDGGEFVGVRD